MKTILLTLLSSFGIGSTAWAAGLGATCETTADCGDGLECAVVGGSDCACAAGTDCGGCEATETKACVPGPCASDADCGDGYVCASFEVPCAGATPEPACPPDASCPEPQSGGADRDCQPESRSVCAPRWVLPCADDAACGDGFTCTLEESCSCAGSSGSDVPPSDPDDASDPAPPDEDDCTCEPGTTKWCQANTITCDDDAQCPDGWSCLRGDTTTETCAAPAGGEPECAPSEPADDDTSGTCAPPGASYGGDSRDVGQELGIPTDAAFDGSNETPHTPTDGTPSAASGGCGGADGALGFALVGLALALVTRRRVA